jgi:dienelactone hydrolase
VLVSVSALAKPVRKTVAYEADTRLEGVLVYDDASRAARPGVVLVPNWLGINEANLKQAELVAGRDYVVFVADMYGKAVRPKDQKEAGAAAGAVKGDRPLMRKRAQAALDALLANAKQANVDAAKVAAIGFCFGGTTVLELAKAGADVKAVVSFHGGLDAPLPTEAAPKAKILVLHGADDPTIPEEAKKAFVEDLKKVKADLQLVEYSGAVHSFTDVDAKVPGRAMYDERTARRAYAAMRTLFAEVF